jgi:ribosomal subunit interface protein
MASLLAHLGTLCVENFAGSGRPIFLKYKHRRRTDMRLEIHYNHLDRSDALDEYVSSKVEILYNVLHRADCHVQVWLVSVHSRFQKGVPEYKCEIDVRYAPKRDLFVAKSATDIYDAINEAIDSAKNLIREESKDQHRRQTITISPPLEP